MPQYKKISKVELKIIEARKSGISISQIDAKLLEEQLHHALISISVISGHGLPEDLLFAGRLTKDLICQLIEFGYESLTVAEIILAFRLNCLCNLKYPSGSEVIPIEIFGKYVSVDYVSKVLSTYMTLRTILDNQLKIIIDGY